MQHAGNASGELAACGGGVGAGRPEDTCRFPKLEECAHFHYERVRLPPIAVSIVPPNVERALHAQHSQRDADADWRMVQVTSGDECWLLQRTHENFRLLDSQLHRCIYDRKISQLPDLALPDADVESLLARYLRRFTAIADDSVNCGPVLNWLQMDNRGHRLLVPSEESRSINTPAVAAAYGVRRYVSQARDELSLEVGDMISVIDMASPGESIWWRGKRGFQVGFFPQHCVHIIGDKVPRNMPLPAPVVGALALSPIKPVLRKHGKLIAFFRSFILHRPSRRRLKQTGILRERVFGCDLGEHLLNSGCDVPTVLKCCAEFIETHGIVDGIYRLSGVTSNIQKLRNAFDEDRVPNLYTEDILQDIHSVASLLKMYFRELPNPLCTYQLYQSFVRAVQGCASVRSARGDRDRLLKMREAVQKLPPPHYRTLEYLARHLAQVAAHGDRTGMTVRNVAIVWAPNLLRSAELEVGGVAALQGVGVQAVVTEFLICYADLIFCDGLDARPHVADIDAAMRQAALLNAASPKRGRPKSLALSTPTKLITLEEARSKHHHRDAYIEVGGGPDSLPKKYHTIIELPTTRKRVSAAKRSPLGWRSLFGKGRNRGQKPAVVHHVASAARADDGVVKPEPKLVLRTVKSAESLSDLDQLPPLQNVLCAKPPGHNRSVSHDSYFDTLQGSQEGSLLDLSEIQVNFDLEESEMRIFSEDESLVSSPRVQPRRVRISSGNNSGNPSPKKQPRVVLSPDSASRKRTRLEEQLGDIQFIDCNTPEMAASAVAQVHAHGRTEEGPRNKSPRNSQCLELRDCRRDDRLSQAMLTSAGTPQSSTPPSPAYKPLESSTTTTPGDVSPHYLANLGKAVASSSPAATSRKRAGYDNVLTTISITYKSPTKTKSFPPESPNYDAATATAEDAQIPTSTANLPLQAAKTLDEAAEEVGSPDLLRASARSATTSMSTIDDVDEDLQKEAEPSSESGARLLSRTPDHLASIEDLRADLNLNEDDDSFPKCDTTLSELIDSYDRIAKATSGDWSHSDREEDQVQRSRSSDADDDRRHYENVTSPATNSSSEDASNCPVNYENVNFASTSNGEVMSGDANGESVFPGALDEELVELEAVGANQEKRQASDEQDRDVYQQVKYFRRSVHELNEFIAATHAPDPAAGQGHASYENVDVCHEDQVAPDREEEEEEEDVAKVIEIIEPCEEVARGYETEHDDIELEVQKRCADDERAYDSLETNDYEPIEFANDSLEADVPSIGARDDDDDDDLLEVRSTANAIELPVSSRLNDADVAMTTARDDATMAVTMTTVDVGESSSSTSLDGAPPEPTKGGKIKQLTSKFEAQERARPLPPCVRARNLKATKTTTRSLDETEFLERAAPRPPTSAEGEERAACRRKSMDENMCGYKTSTLPKTLNKPKRLPDDPDVGPHVVAHDVLPERSVNLNRERIEKYKEERRKFLHDKYRSESFKENKDVLLSRFKVFKPAVVVVAKEEEEAEAGSDVALVGSAEDGAGTMIEQEKRVANGANGVRSKTAMFESEPEVEMRPGGVSSRRQKVLAAPAGSEDREREREGAESAFEQARRSFEPPQARKDRSSSSYCIKDMKAIFESKSQQ